MNLVFNALYIFCIALDTVLFLFVIASWFPIGPRLRGIFAFVLDPLLEPIRYLLRRSIFNTHRDLSPLIGFIVIAYLQRLIGSFLS